MHSEPFVLGLGKHLPQKRNKLTVYGLILNHGKQLLGLPIQLKEMKRYEYLKDY